MLEKIVVALIIALLKYLGYRAEQSKKPVVADRAADGLRRVGDRVADWERLHKAGPDPRRQPGADRSQGDGEDLRTD